MRLRLTRLWWICLLGWLLPTGAGAAERSFSLQGVSVVLDDVTTEVGVLFRSMRLNRAQGVWNAEMVLTNRSDRLVEGPLVVSMEELRGIGGWVGADGEAGEPAMPYLDFSDGLEQGQLLPGQSTAARVISMEPVAGQVPAPVLAVFGRLDPNQVALAWVQTLDAAGLPLASVTVEESGPAGTTTRTSDSESGLLTLGDSGGSFLWKFSNTDYLPVWRTDLLDGSGVALLPNPQLTPRSGESEEVTPLGGQTLGDGDVGIEILMGAGQVAQTTRFTLTGLDSQSLPALLPGGWSPLQAFWLESDQALTSTLTAQATLWDSVQATDTVALVRWDDEALVWRTVGLVAGEGSEHVVLELSALGAYAVVVADAGSAAPSEPVAGGPLTAGVVGGNALRLSDADWQRMDLDPALLEAEGAVSPPLRLASLVPSEVTAEASVVIRHPGADLPSGLVLRAEISETYRMRDGTVRSLPSHERFLIGYRRPGGADSRELHASFPLRPQFLLPGDELVEASIDVDVYAGGIFTGKVLGAKGGQAVFDNFKLLVPAGSLPRTEAVRLRKLSVGEFDSWLTEGYVPVEAFELGVGDLSDGARFLFEATGMPPDSLYVLARVLMEGTWRGFEPVERLVSDADGRVKSLEPAEGPRLGGMRQAGQYVLVRVPQPQGLVEGVARNAAGEVTAGLPVRLNLLPWLTVSGEGGVFQLVAPEGESELAALDPATGDFGSVLVTLVTATAGVQTDLSVVASGPQVVSVTPDDGAVRVPASTSVQVAFSEPVTRVSFAGDGVRLLAADGTAVPGSVSLNLSGTRATFLPAQQLSRGKTYTVEVKPGVADGTGLTLEGPNTFSFEVIPASTRREGAQLVIYEPGATNVPPEIADAIPAFTPGEDPFAIVVHGQPGVADPEVPVVLANESTGETQTVLSKVDGSFSSFIGGTEEDFISATFVNLNGTRVYVPVSRQEFDNGFVGLYQQGGILEAQSDGGPVQVLVEPGDLKSRTKLAVQPVAVSEVMNFLSGVQPEGGAVVGGAVVAIDDPLMQESKADISFPVDLSSLNLQPGVLPEDVTWGLAIPHDFGEGTVFEIIDELEYDNGQLRTSGLSPSANPQMKSASSMLRRSSLQAMDSGVVTEQVQSPYTVGLFFQMLGNLREAGGVRSGRDSLGAASGVAEFFGLPDVQETVTHQLLLPLMMAQGTSVNIGGVVKTVRLLEDGSRDTTFEGEPVLGATIMLEKPPLTAQPGKLRSGAMYTSSFPPNGSYSFRVPVTLEGADTLITGTHPRFPFQRARGGVSVGSLADRFSYGNFALLPLFFEELDPSALLSGEDIAHPVIRLAHAPNLPAPTTGETSGGAEVVVEALDDREVSLLELRLRGVTSLTDGQPLDSSVVTLESLVEEVGSQSIRRRYQLQSTVAASVRLEARSVDSSGNEALADYSILFGGVPPVIDPENPDDRIGPRVLFTWPRSGATGVRSGTPLVVRFSEPLGADMFTSENQRWLTFADHEVVSVEPSPDYRQITVRYHGAASRTVNATISSTLLDRNGQSFDQAPAIDGAQSYTLQFELAESLSRSLEPAPTLGGGVVFKGAYAFALDRLGPRDGEVAVFSLEDPATPVKVGSVSLPGYPTAMELIPDYSFKLGEGGDCLSGDFLAVAGGSLGSESSPKYLWVIDISQPENPVRLASAAISFSETARIQGMKWKAPLLGLTVLEGDVTSIQMYHLPKFVYGLSTPAVLAAEFPENGTVGLDLNGDGDFCDPGDVYPLPSKQANQVFGFELSLASESPEERIMDFDVDINRGLFGIVYRSVGETSGRIGYRTLFYQGQFPQGTDGHLLLAENGFVKYLTLLPGTFMEPDEGGQAEFRDLALVTVSENPGKLILLDLADPLAPVMLGPISLPPDAGGAQNVIRRGDGLLVVATPNRLLLLDPGRLLLPDRADGHQAFVGEVSGIGSNMQRFVADTSGVNLASSGSMSRFLFSGPTFQVVSFPSVMEVAEVPFMLEEAKRELLRSAQDLPVLAVDPLGFETAIEPNTVPVPLPIQPATHYYVYVTMPGGTGAEVPLTAVSLSADGKEIQRGGAGGMPAFLSDAESYHELVTDEENPSSGVQNIPWKKELIARRLSDDPMSPLYNSYLAGPMVLARRALRLPQFEALEQQSERNYLRAGRYLWVGLAPGAASQSSFLAGYASRVAGDELIPGSSRIYPVAARENPLIFIPGVMGSLLEQGSNNAWIGLADREKDNLLTGPGGDSIEAITPSDALRYKGQGTLAETIGRSLPDTLSDGLKQVLSVYGLLLEHLVRKLGYVEYDYVADNSRADMEGKRGLGENPEPYLAQDPKPNLFVFPYDWRLDNADNADRLHRYLELVRHYHPDVEKVDILAHSMGGLMARNFQLKHPDLVDRFITIGSPWLGAPKALAAMKTGDFDDWTMNFLIQKSALKNITRDMKSIHQLLPSRSYFTLAGDAFREVGWDVNGEAGGYQQYSYEDYRQMVDGDLFAEDDGEETHAAPIRDGNEVLHTPDQDDWSNDETGAEFYHIVGVQSAPKTIGRVLFSTRLTPATPEQEVVLFTSGAGFTDFENGTGRDERRVPEDLPNLPLGTKMYRIEKHMEFSRVAGDGTVPLLSASRGSGSDLDLNAKGALVLPIVSTSLKDDWKADHTDMLNNPEVLSMVGDILEGGVPTTTSVEIELDNDWTEGTGSTLRAITTEIPAEAEGDPVYVWDFGDGTTATGSNTVDHIYWENGIYTVTCLVSFNNGYSGLTSRTVSVSNAPPVISEIKNGGIELPPDFYTTLEVVFADPGIMDTHTFGWSVDGGDPVSGGFTLPIGFREEGSHQIQVTVMDDDSGNATLSTTVDVRAGAEPPVIAQDFDQDPPPVPGNGPPGLYIRLAGHNHELDSRRLYNDGRDAFAPISGLPFAELQSRIFRSAVGSIMDDGSKNSEFIHLIREENAEGMPVTLTELRLESVGEPFAVDMLVQDGNIPRRYFGWEVLADAGDTFTVSYDWYDSTAALLKNGELITPLRLELGPKTADRLGPAVEARINDPDQTVTFSSRDNITSPEEIQTVIAVDTNDDGSFLDERFYEWTGSEVPVSVLPTRSLVVAGRDAVGNLSSLEPTAVVEAAVADGYDCDKLDIVRQTVQLVITEGLQLDLVQQVLVSRTNVWFFEQGTGACLWKDPCESCRGVYIFGKSDNDYEMFFPVHLNNPPSMEEFLASDPYSESNMTGDWYFRRPVRTVDGSGGEVFRYFLPPGRENSRGEAQFDIPVDFLSNPLTPAEIISKELTELVSSNSRIKAVLPDVSFFPFRAEHFQYGVMSLERPPPFGDDPIGDAGMGRSLLLLKWVLEGAYVQFENDPELNANAPALSEVFENLKLQGIPLAEGFEWGVYQDFAALSGGVHLFVEQTSAEGSENGSPRANLADGFDKHNEKSIKKAGKAAIRAALARLAGDPEFNDVVLSISPEEYRDTFGLRSFEEFIYLLSQLHPEAFAGYEEDIRRFYLAKLADPELFAELREQGGEKDFILRCQQFLRTFVQPKTLQAYQDYMEARWQNQGWGEVLQRDENMYAVEFGFQPVGAPKFFPGRHTMQGRDPNRSHVVPYEMLLGVANMGSSGSASVQISMRSGSTGVMPQTSNITLATNESRLIRGSAKDGSLTNFYLAEVVSDRGVLEGSLEMQGSISTSGSNQSGAEVDQTKNTFYFTHEFLGLTDELVVSSEHPLIKGSIVETSETPPAYEMTFQVVVGSEFVEGAVIYLLDSSGFRSVVPGGRVSFAEAGDSTLEVLGETPDGVATKLFRIKPSLTGLFRRGGPATGPEQLMLNLMDSQFPGIEPPLNRLMTYQLLPIWEELMSFPDVVAFQAQASRYGVEFIDPVTACSRIGKLLIFEDKVYFNPGRQKFGEPIIYLHDKLLSMDPIPLFVNSAPAIDVTASEVIHELNFRANHMLRGGRSYQLAGNGESRFLDYNAQSLYPRLKGVASKLIQVSPPGPEPTCEANSEGQP